MTLVGVSHSVATPQPELYRIRDAAAVLAVSPRMVYALIEAGVLRTIHLPSSGTRRRPVRIARADLLAFIERQRNETVK
jgi:excisionase family DNA binding protein